MESLGYGDYICSKCRIISYSESEEDFNKRIYKGEENENGNGC